MDWWRKKKNKKKQILERGKQMLLEDLIECCDGKSNPIKFFSAHEILNATDHFSDSNRVPNYLSYIDYRWYSGKNENQQGILIAVSSMVSGHKNFVKLVGCCLEFEDPVLVFHGVKKHYELDVRKEPWKRRMKIAEYIATALAYLHTAFPRPFVYRCLIIRNIFLDEDGVAKLIDFSHCLLIPKGDTFVKVDRTVAFYGTDYKYMKSGVVSEKTDVFDFGILLLTLLVGKRNLSSFFSLQEESFSRYVPHWRFNFLEELTMDEIADPEMLEKICAISEQGLTQMNAFRMLSLRCLGRKGKVPTMVEVAKEQKKFKDLLTTTLLLLQVKPNSTLPKSFLPQSSSQTRVKYTKAFC